MTAQLRSQRAELLVGQRADRQPPPLHRGGAVRRHRRRHRHRRRRARHDRQPHRAAAPRPRRERPIGAADRRGRCRSSAPVGRGRAARRAPGAPRPDRRHRAAAASAPSTSGSRPKRADGRVARLRHHPRRHHRPRRGAAQLGLGRRRPPHRPRDQEPADADPAFGRAAAPQIRQGDHRGPRGLRPVHRHDHPPGRRHRPHGRRVLVLRAHAEAGLRDAQPLRVVREAVFLHRGRPSRHRLQARRCPTSRCSAASTRA